MRSPIPILALFASFVAGRPDPGEPPAAAGSDERNLDREFRETVRPFLATYCGLCHGGEKAKGGLDLAGYRSATDVAKDFRAWERVGDYLRVGAMPPEKAEKRPTEAERKTVLAWAAAVRRAEAKRTAGDPGPAVARRM